MNESVIKELAVALKKHTNNTHFIEGTIKTLRTDSEKKEMILYLNQGEKKSITDISYKIALIIGPRLQTK